MYSRSSAGLGFRKSSYSKDDTECVEIADANLTVAIRDSKDPGGPVLSFSRTAFTDFIQRTKQQRR